MNLSVKKLTARVAACILLMFTVALAFALPALAEGPDGQDTSASASASASTVQSDSASTAGKSIGSGIAIGIAAGGGAIGMGIAVAKAADGISRQPEAESKIRTTLMLGLVFIETAIIYALLVVILLIFVL